MTLQEIVDRGRRIVFFGGAGVSTESGIPDFRSQDGLYRQKYKYPPEVILSRTFFELHPAEFFDFYRAKMLCLDAKPNAAHLKLAEMERKGKLHGLVTQNIDGLHRAAGSRELFELHGCVHRNSAWTAAGCTMRSSYCTRPASPGARAVGWSSRTWCATRSRWTRPPRAARCG